MRLDSSLARPDARAALEKELADRYRDVPGEPYVLPVLAGECVELTIGNLLSDPLPDDSFGDALMPRITPLNTAPAPGLVSRAESGRPQVNELDMQAGQPLRHGLRPAACGRRRGWSCSSRCR